MNRKLFTGANYNKIVFFFFMLKRVTQYDHLLKTQTEDDLKMNSIERYVR